MRVGSKVLTLSTITISQPACPAHSGHVLHVTQRTRDLSQNLGNRKRLEDVIRPLKTRPGELQVHLQTGVVQACGSQPPVDHINLEHLRDVAGLPLLESGHGPVGLGDVHHGQDDQTGSDAGPHQQRQHQRHLRDKVRI